MTNIRDAQIEDAPAILSLMAEMAADSAEPNRLTAPYLAEYFRSANSYILVAEENGGVIGLLSYSLRPDLYHAGTCCLIEELVIHKEKRSQGIGGLLLDTLLHSLTEKGCVEAALGVMPENVDAQRFYQRHGICEQALLLEKHF